MEQDDGETGWVAAFFERDVQRRRLNRSFHWRSATLRETAEHGDSRPGEESSAVHGRLEVYTTEGGMVRYYVAQTGERQDDEYQSP
jgi:hypothetical protein